MNFESFREKIGYQPVLLGSFALLASGALAWASGATGDAIAAAEAKDLRDSLSEVLPAGMADNDFLNFKLPNGNGWGYCVFGKVVEGQDVVDAIKSVKTGNAGFHQDVPKEDVIIEKAEVC